MSDWGSHLALCEWMQYVQWEGQSIVGLGNFGLTPLSCLGFPAGELHLDENDASQSGSSALCSHSARFAAVRVNITRADLDSPHTQLPGPSEA